jgi:hypothetical protein
MALANIPGLPEPSPASVSKYSVLRSAIVIKVGLLERFNLVRTLETYQA